MVLQKEPHLQPLPHESILHPSSITDDDACLDVAMYGY